MLTHGTQKKTTTYNMEIQVLLFVKSWSFVIYGITKKHSLLLISVMRKYISMLLDKANNLQNKYFTNSCIPE